MPTLFILFGFRFQFWANDHLPIHIHAIKGNSYAKIQVFPEVEVMENKGLTASELKKSNECSGRKPRNYHRALERIF